MTETETRTGGCHCGKVRYEVRGLGLEQVISCNCSICTQRGLLLAFVPPEQFTLLSGAGELADYQFNRKTIHHLFCRSCGIESFARGVSPTGAEMVAINVRSLDGVDIAALTPTPFDGRKL